MCVLFFVGFGYIFGVFGCGLGLWEIEDSRLMEYGFLLKLGDEYMGVC